MQYIIDEVKALNYDYLRVYTDKVVNPISILLYNKMFDVKEAYLNSDKIGWTKNFVVFTKYLNNKREKWHNRSLNEDDNYNF